MVKNLPASAGDTRDVGSIPGLGRSSGEGYCKPFQYCLGNPMDRGAWRTAVPVVTKVRQDCATEHELKGDPDGLSGKESACQCRRHRFNP